MFVGICMVWVPASAGAVGSYEPVVIVNLLPSDFAGYRYINHIKVNASGWMRVPVNAMITVFPAPSTPYDHPVDIYMGLIEPGMTGLQTFQFISEPRSYGTLVRNWLPIVTNYTLLVGGSPIPQGNWDLLPNSPRGLYTMFVVIVNTGDDASDTRKWITNAARYLMVE